MDKTPTEIPPEQDEVARLRERLFLAPHDTETMAGLAALFERAGDLPAAIDLRQRALRVDPYEIGHLLALGRLWLLLADRQRAASWYRRALAVEPDCAAAQTGLAAATEPDGLTETYIRTLFDQYAGRFDAELTGTLAYRAPALVAAALARCAIPPASADILDLGCGTGLSGLALKPFAQTLDGVDLSPAMVAKAKARGIYDTLAVGEALAFLGQSQQTWHIIAAVDMLNYLGDLGPLFRAVTMRLSPDGRLVGTVEKRREGGLALTAKRRFTHGADHVEQAAREAGLEIAEITEAALRTEGGAEVAGLVFVARQRA